MEYPISSKLPAVERLLPTELSILKRPIAFSETVVRYRDDGSIRSLAKFEMMRLFGT
jgi:hypothetical protein